MHLKHTKNLFKLRSCEESEPTPWSRAKMPCVLPIPIVPVANCHVPTSFTCSSSIFSRHRNTYPDMLRAIGAVFLDDAVWYARKKWCSRKVKLDLNLIHSKSLLAAVLPADAWHWLSCSCCVRGRFNLNTIFNGTDAALTEHDQLR